MLKKLKSLITALIILVSTQTFADSKCVASAEGSVHEGFCANVGVQFCKTHSVCKLVTREEKVIIIKEEKKEKCESKPGQEGQQVFCSNLDKQTCSVHSALCAWR